MTPSLVAALLGIGFVSGFIFCWPIAQRRGELKAMRHGYRDEDDDEWWNL